MAVIGFQGRLVAGVGKSLRIYEMGKKKLLRKTENRVYRFEMISEVPDFAFVEFCLCYCYTDNARFSDYRR